ncbi:beta-class carbonic anhydrase [Conexibacter arvalis]|uniref:carbonic anhydrase n=1 Tax=Conexibacter arvalis TaxID=912552 RepID=A0A840IID1_9ACTN|nr:carbonic anhydrase [Conexibacter arvalis]MBB4663794.1 carbonic anhydrase [Conexibacter arvalis]
MSVIDELLRKAQSRPPQPIEATGSRTPHLRLAVVLCMDAGVDPLALLGIGPGDAHVLRNAGGVVTDDTIRSLAISQRVLGTEEVMLIHHTGCELELLDEEEFRDELRRETGLKPSWPAEAFGGDVDTDVRQSIARVEASPFLLHVDRVRGFVHDLTSGRLREIG